jgi:hypothetical protein
MSERAKPRAEMRFGILPSFAQEKWPSWENRNGVGIWVSRVASNLEQKATEETEVPEFSLLSLLRPVAKRIRQDKPCTGISWTVNSLGVKNTKFALPDEDALTG